MAEADQASSVVDRSSCTPGSNIDNGFLRRKAREKVATYDVRVPISVTRGDIVEEDCILVGTAFETPKGFRITLIRGLKLEFSVSELVLTNKRI